MAISPSTNGARPTEARTIRRFFLQGQAPITRVRADRLTQTKWQLGNLSYRAATLSDDEARTYARRWLTRLVFLLPPLFFAIITLPLFLPGAEIVAFVVGLVVAVIRALLFRVRKPRAFLATTFLPPLALVAGDVIRGLLSARGGGPFVIGFLSSVGPIALVVLLLSNLTPHGFGWLWITSEPSYTAEDSATARRLGPVFGIGALRGGAKWLTNPIAWVAVGFTLLLVILGGFFARWLLTLDTGRALWALWLDPEKFTHRPLTTLPLAGFLAVFFFFGLTWLFWRVLLRQVGELFGHYLTYDGASTGAPGVLHAPNTVQERRSGLIWAASIALLCSFTSANFFIPPTSGGRFFSGYAALQEADRRASSISANTTASERRERPGQSIDRLPNPLLPLPDAPEATSSGALGILGEWLSVPAAYVSLRGSAFLWLLATSALFGSIILGALLLVPLLALAEIRAFTKLRYGATRERWHSEDPTRTSWQTYVDRLRDSAWSLTDWDTGTTIRERDHLFLGIEPNGNFPVLLHEKLLREHVYIVGDSGSGKTSLGIMPILKQVMRPSELPDDSYEEPSPPAPVLILDLKGDNALFHLTRQLAAKRGQPFLYFTPEEQRASHHFNPFADFDRKSRSLSSFATLFLDALSLNHGEGYGRGYYTARNRQLLYSLLEEKQPETFKELYKHLAGKKGRVQDEAFELVATVQMLAGYKILNGLKDDPTLPEERIIQMKRLITKNEVAYFWLPAAIESISVREIGKLALFSLLSAAIARQRAGDETKTVYVVVDEFQRLAGENFSILLEQARSFGLSLILANQTISDLNLPSKDLRPSVRTNTRTKFFFSVTEPEELRMLSSLSGQEITETRSRSTSVNQRFLLPTSVDTESVNEQITPRLTPQDIQLISDHPNEFLLLVSRGGGFTQFGGLPVPVRTEWPMPQREYAELSSLPWPELPETREAQRREGLTVEEKSVKAREREVATMSEEFKAMVAADLAGYAEIRFTAPPADDPQKAALQDKLASLYESSTEA